MELSESKSALKEIEKSGEDVFKMIGQLMIKSDKKKIVSELSNKEKLLGLRLDSIEKQVKSLSEGLEKLQSEILG
jgi:prefoldin beta subunit